MLNNVTPSSFTIGGMQPLSLIDYPGKVAAIIFTQGCSFRCVYCHNPDLVLPERFTAPLDIDDVYAFLESRKGKLDGVVVTGGEPALQKDLIPFLASLKAMGYLVKLDTSGISPTRVAQVLDAGVVDYFAMDIKAPLHRYPHIIGIPIDTERIEQSIRLIMESGIDYEFRTTVVEGLLSKDDILEIGKLIAGAKRYALQHFVPTQTLDPQMKSAESFLQTDMEALRAEMESTYVKKCIIR
jgi:pyruvate formate lyase activating enzyme